MLVGMVLYVGSIAAGTYDQLWDYRTAPLYSAGMRTDSLDANAAFFIRALMNANAGGEYRTMDQEGRVVSPETNEVTFVLDGKSRTMNTILNNINFEPQ